MKKQKYFKNKHWKPRYLTLVLMLMAINPVAATDTDVLSEDDYANNMVEFDSDILLLGGKSKVDVSRFERGASASPGQYKVNIFVNNELVANESVEFKENAKKRVYPCLTPKLTQLINFKEDALPVAAKAELDSPGQCVDIEALIPDSNVDFKSNEQELYIEVPQLYVNRTAQGAVNPALWDSGIPSFLLGYYINGYDSHYKGSEAMRSAFASLNTGLNIGAWYFRHNGSYSWQKETGGHYQTSNTYLQRDIAAIRGRIVLGEYNTTGQQFNSVPFSGVQIVSDDRMLADSQRGYAPEIRGIAKTNAKVSVRQQGNIIYETTVTPGAFLINDLYPTGYGGDLEVTIQEADGTTSQYTMAYASVAQLLRPGVQQFSITAGKLRDSHVSDEPTFTEATWTRGLNNTFTAYAGGQLSKYYKAFDVGLAMGTGLGAISADVTQSYSQLGEEGGGEIKGQSYRVSYSKLISETNSNITLAAYRYSSSGYMDFLQATQTRDALKNKDNNNGQYTNSKNRFTLSINQGLLPGWGNLFASATMENYWNEQKGYNKQYQVGYSNSYKRLNYSINVSKTKTAFGTSQTTWFLNFTLPLWEDTQSRSPYLSMRYNQDNQGGRGQQAMLSGGLGENNKYGYNLTAAHDNASGTSGSLGGTWQSRAATINGSYSMGKNYNSRSIGLSGAMVAHSGGVTLTPFNSDTYALIEAKGAEGAKVSGYGGAMVDGFGYALYPSLTPYKMNQVSIDPEGSALDVEFENTGERIAPRAGAIVKVKFKTRSGIPLLIASNYQGDLVPFGAEVFDDKNEYVGAVSQGGVIYARVQQEKGTLMVKWGEDMESRCQVTYMLMPGESSSNKNKLPQQFNIPCMPPQIQMRAGKEGTALAIN